jgi:hypothetical protein
MDDQSARSKAALSVDAALAEFEAIRSEVRAKAGGRLNLIGIYITAISVVGGLVLSGGVDAKILLAIPLLSSGFALAIVGEGRDLAIAASYVHDVLRPIIVDHTSENRLFGFEQYYRDRSLGPFLAKSVGMGILFPGVSVAILATSAFRLKSPEEWTAWCAGIAMLVATMIVSRHRIKRFLRSMLRRPPQ